MPRPSVVCLPLALALLPWTAQGQDAQRDRDPDGTWHFYMTQQGRRMSADDFDRWLAERGLRVAGQSRAVGGAPAPTAWTPEPAPSGLSPVQQPLTRPIAETGPLLSYDSGSGQGTGTEDISRDLGPDERAAPASTTPLDTLGWGSSLTSYDSGQGAAPAPIVSRPYTRDAQLQQQSRAIQRNGRGQITGF